MREIALWAGNTAVAATLVMGVFFASAALGNILGGRLISKNTRPLLLYARCEVWAALAALGLFHSTGWMQSQVGWIPDFFPHAVVLAILLVAVPSFLSGIAFPCLAETFVEDSLHRTSTGGIFYGANLLGAAAGGAAGAVWLPWWLGVKGAFVVAVCLQIASGLIARRLARHFKTRGLAVKASGSQSRGNEYLRSDSRAKIRPDSPVGRADASSKRPVASIQALARSGVSEVPPWLGWSLLVISGVLSLGAQGLLVLWVRQVFEGSIYAVGGVLSTFIGGLGMGALAAAALRRRGRNQARLLSWFTLGSSLLLFAVPEIGSRLTTRDVALTAMTPIGMILQSIASCAWLLLPLTFCLGGVFPVAWEWVLARGRSQGLALGCAQGANKLGAAAGAVVSLFVLMPWLGLVRGTQVIAWCYAILTILAALSCRGNRLLIASGATLLVMVGLHQTVREHPELGLTPDIRKIASYSGPYGPVSVVEDTLSGSRQILLNSRQRLSGTRHALSSQRHQSWVPLLFCRELDRVVTIGMAAGISATAALDFPIRELYSIELIPEVVRAAREHFEEWNKPLFEDPRSHVVVGDGRSVVAGLKGSFDAIICDLFFPKEEGAAMLYSREFFRDSIARLSPGGVFCLWLPCYQHSAESAGVVIRTFMDVFPRAVAVRANLDPLAPIIGLLGSRDLLPFSPEFLGARLASPFGKALANRSPFFASPDNALLLMVCDLHSADPGFELHPPTTDDRPLFSYLGPKRLLGGERLHGFPFLEWMGKRALRPHFPSCGLRSLPPSRMLQALRAGNHYFAAAAASATLPGDSRPAGVRLEQVRTYLERAATLFPEANFPFDALGR